LAGGCIKVRGFVGGRGLVAESSSGQVFVLDASRFHLSEAKKINLKAAGLSLLA
jgi:hypothetical protein